MVFLVFGMLERDDLSKITYGIFCRRPRINMCEELILKKL